MGTRRHRAGAIDAQNVNAGEDEQARERHHERGRDPAGEMIERRNLGAVVMRLRRGQGPEHILEGLAHDQRHGRDLARDFEQAGGAGARGAGQHHVEEDRRRVDEGAAREVRGEEDEAGADQVADEGAGEGGADQQLEIVITAEQRDAEQGGHRQRAEVREHQPDAARAREVEADREADPCDLLPENAQANLGPERAAGRGRSPPR